MMTDAVMCGVSVEAFWRLTPQEFRNVLSAYASRRDHDMDIAAWHLSHIINLVVKANQRVTPAKLRGKAETLMGLDMFASVEEYQAYLNARLEGVDDGD